MNIPNWIKLAAASNDELLEEVLNTIEEMGGINKAQEALRQSNKKSNWAMLEKYVIAKSVVDLGREMPFFTDPKEEVEVEVEEVKPIAPTPAESKHNPEVAAVEAPKEKLEEEPKKEENHFQGPPAEGSTGKPNKENMSQAAYLASLLGMFLAGAGGVLGAQQLSNFDLRNALLNVVNKEQGLNNRVTERLRGMLENKPERSH